MLEIQIKFPQGAGANQIPIEAKSPFFPTISEGKIVREGQKT